MKSLTGRQKARVITMAFILAYLCYGICAYAWDVRMQTPQFDYVDEMQVDGSEMAPVANLFVAGTNGLISFITMILSIAAMVVIGLILLVPWRCISLRKKSQVTEDEWKITKYLFYVFCAVSLMGGLVILRFTNLLYLLLLTAVTASLIVLLVLWPVHRAFCRCELEKEQEERIEQHEY